MGKLPSIAILTSKAVELVAAIARSKIFQQTYVVLTKYLITFDYFKFVSILLVIIQRSKYFANDPNIHILV